MWAVIHSTDSSDSSAPKEQDLTAVQVNIFFSVSCLATVTWNSTALGMVLAMVLARRDWCRCWWGSFNDFISKMLHKVWYVISIEKKRKVPTRVVNFYNQFNNERPDRHENNGSLKQQQT